MNGLSLTFSHYFNLGGEGYTTLDYILRNDGATEFAIPLESLTPEERQWVQSELESHHQRMSKPSHVHIEIAGDKLIQELRP